MTEYSAFANALFKQNEKLIEKYAEKYAVNSQPIMPYCIPNISSINDIRCNFIIDVCDDFIGFRIETLDIVREERDETDTIILFKTSIILKKTKLTIEDYETSVKEIFETIDNLTFDKSLSKFIDNRNNCKEDKDYHNNTDIACSKLVMLIKNPNVKKTINECCVCYEATNIKTKCNHSLCLCCWSKCKKVNDDDDAIIECPMCKKEVDCCL